MRNQRTLSIIIPVFNEEKTIVKVLQKIFSIHFSGWKKEIIIVNDGSTDQTSKLLKKFSQKCKIIYHIKNLGKGSSIRTGIKQSHGDYVIIQDADLEYNPLDIKRMLLLTDQQNIQVIYGSRFLTTNKVMVPFHKDANIFLTKLTNFLFNSHLSDMETCYKLIKSDLLKSFTLSAKRFEFEPEITTKLLLKKIPIVEIPISYTKRSFTQGKKITFYDGLQAIFILFKYRFFKYRN